MDYNLHSKALQWTTSAFTYPPPNPPNVPPCTHPHPPFLPITPSHPQSSTAAPPLGGSIKHGIQLPLAGCGVAANMLAVWIQWRLGQATRKGCRLFPMIEIGIAHRETDQKIIILWHFPHGNCTSRREEKSMWSS